MALKIEISFYAQNDLDHIVSYISADSPSNASRWLTRLHKKINAIAFQPESYAFAPENHYSDINIRQMLFGRYRILFTCKNNTVYILTLRHSARRMLRKETLERL